MRGSSVLIQVFQKPAHPSSAGQECDMTLLKPVICSVWKRLHTHTRTRKKKKQGTTQFLSLREKSNQPVCENRYCLIGPHRQNSQIGLVVLAHAHTFHSKESGRMEGKDFPIRLFPRSHREGTVFRPRGVIDALAREIYSRKHSRTPVSKWFSTFCGV